MDELSSASADRNVDRMMHQTSYLSRHPAPLSMPLSARAATEETEEEPAKTVKPPPTPQAQVADVLNALESLGPDFYAHTTPTERSQVRRATCPPHSSLERTVHTNPQCSLLTASLLAMAVGVLVGTTCASSPSSRFRATSTSKRAVDRMLRYA